MLDTHFRGYIQPLLDKIASLAITLGLTPVRITIAAFLTGMISVLALCLGWNGTCVSLLWISGLFDAIDGTVARKTNSITCIGTFLDITFDRIVELGIILALGFTSIADSMMLLVLTCSIVLSMTIFLTVGNLAERKGEKSFYYQGGLVERTEGFIFFTLMILMLMPLIPYESSIYADERSMGLMNQLDFGVLEIVAGFFLLDLVIYFQHRIFHKVPVLWKLHSMHHIDPMLDTTSGLRFHPIEIILSNFIKIITIIALGIAPLAVIIFEIVLNGLAMFNHSNLNIPNPFEKILNKVLITPALHTIHHSKIIEETMSNYGFSVPWWDKIFGTFCPRGKYPQERIDIGTIHMPKEKYTLFPGMLVQPFISSGEHEG